MNLLIYIGIIVIVFGLYIIIIDNDLLKNKRKKRYKENQSIRDRFYIFKTILGLFFITVGFFFILNFVYF